jgi:cell division protein DivIC
MIRRLPKFTRNFFFIFGCFFLFWLLFIDSNDLISQYRLDRKLENLEAEKEYYEAKIDQVKQEREELFSDPELLEKFAREKYLMKKDNEDLYIITQE